MSEQEHRPILDPGILGRMATSMESIREAWDADVADLRATKAVLADTQQKLATANDRIDDITTDFRDVRAENIRLINRNAYLEAEVRKFAETSRDARDQLTVLAERALTSTADGQPVPAPSADRLNDVAATEADHHADHQADLRERAQQAVEAIGRNDDDGHTPTVQDIPLFLRKDLTDLQPHRTTIAPNVFGRRNGR